MTKLTWFKSETTEAPYGEPGEREYPDGLDIFESNRAVADLQKDPRTIQIQISSHTGSMNLVWEKDQETGVWSFRSIGV